MCLLISILFCAKLVNKCSMCFLYLMQGIDLEAVGKINGVPTYEFDLDTVDDKPWRKPG